MNTSNITKTKEIITSEDEKILRDAENIIFKSNEDTRHKKRNIIFICIALIIIFILLIVFSTIFAIMNINNTKIMNGVYIQGIDVSNLDKDEAKEKLTSIVEEHLSSNITLIRGEYSTVISPSEFNVTFDISSAIDEAYSVGRSGNLFERNFTILNLLTSKASVGTSLSYDDDLLNSIISNLTPQLLDHVVDPDYYLEDSNLIIVSGNDGVIVNSDSLKEQILSALHDMYSNDVCIEIPVISKAAEGIDIDAAYASIYKDPIDAYYTIDPYVVYPSANGLDFGISLEEAKEMLAEKQDTYTIPLKTLYPNVTTSQIGIEAFPDLLSEFTTTYSTSNSGRATNLHLAAEKVNGTVVMPGETFSYNKTVGQRTIAAGFKAAAAYSGGKVVQEVGGGICQISTTLYNAVLLANLEITERYNHGFEPSYVKPGMDATVSWGGPDFKFTNNRDYPIKIVSYANNGIANFKIYGLKRDTDYKVVIDSYITSTIYYTTTYQKDSSLPSGTSKVIQSGSNGCKSVTYKSLYDSDGNLVSKECISRDTYNPHNKIVAVGP